MSSQTIAYVHDGLKKHQEIKAVKCNHYLVQTFGWWSIAASLIGGTTLYWFAGLPTTSITQSDNWSENTSRNMRETWIKNLLHTLWVATDEVSMCTLNMLTLFSQVSGKIWAHNGVMDATVPFSRLNIMLIGDFHQFLPVEHATFALYSSPQQRNSAVVEKAIYKQFDIVINLMEQKHIINHQ